ncbi:MAG: hypothetical protein U0974_08390 [Gemmatimonadales bacterium]|nr:hypothetical protein [Gemmatimonadales bacterium]MDZ4389734.1 hypothetical protein [Gemmatimonadales bacterium]
MDELKLRELEDRAFRAYLDDGSADVLLGGMVVAFGVSLASDIDYLVSVLVVLAVPGWLKFRERLVEPRRGYVQLGPARRARVSRYKSAFMVAGFLVCATLWAIVIGPEEWRGAVQPHSRLIPSVLFAVTALCGAVLLRTSRLVGYAGVLIVAGGFGQVGLLPRGLELVIAGLVITAHGMVRIRDFLRRFPAVDSTGGATID